VIAYPYANSFYGMLIHCYLWMQAPILLLLVMISMENHRIEENSSIDDWTIKDGLSSPQLYSIL